MSRAPLSRKEFLQALLAFTFSPLIWTGRSLAFPINQVLGPATHGYLREYLRRLHLWHCAQFFDFNRAFDRRERAYFEYCRDHMDSWGWALEPETLISNFLYSHRFEDDRISHGRLTLGCGPHQKQASLLAQSILRHRGIRTDLGDFFSLGWDFDQDRFKVYSLKRAPEKVQSGVSESGDQTIFHNRFLSCSVYEKNKKIDQRSTRFLKKISKEFLSEIPFSSVVVSASLTAPEGDSTRLPYSRGRQLNLRLKQFHASFLNPQSKRTADCHEREFALNPFFIRWKSKKSHTLYYP